MIYIGFEQYCDRKVVVFWLAYYRAQLYISSTFPHLPAIFHCLCCAECPHLSTYTRTLHTGGKRQTTGMCEVVRSLWSRSTPTQDVFIFTLCMLCLFVCFFLGGGGG